MPHRTAGGLTQLSARDRFVGTSVVGFVTELGDNRAMTRRTFDTIRGPATLRRLAVEDAAAVAELLRVAGCHGNCDVGNCDFGNCDAGHVRSQLAAFPDGQLGVEVGGTLIGVCASLIVHLGRDGYRPHTHVGITDGGYFHTHDRSADTLYVAQLCVAPAWQDLGIAAELVRALQTLCRQLRLRRLVSPVTVTEKAPVEVAPATNGSADLLAFFTAREFAQVCTLRGYHHTSAGPVDAQLVEWANPDYEPSRQTPGVVRLAMVQHRMRGVRNFDEFARQIEYFVAAAKGYDADFVLFPEFTSMQLLSTEGLAGLPSRTGVSRLADQAKAVFGLFAGLAKRHGLNIIGGSHPALVERGGKHVIQNVCPIALADGRVFMQPKLHITPSEREAWDIEGGDRLAVIETPVAKIGVLICYDSEFPEAARHLADQGVDILFVPYCTDDRQGHLRVRWCCQARAVENQIYVATAGVIGNLPGAAGMDVHYGRAAVFTPSDFSFARDGIQAEADPNVETLLVTELDLTSLYRAREHGSVRPRRDRRPDLFQLTTRFAAEGLSEYRFDD